MPMARPRKAIEEGEVRSVPVRLDKNDLDWVDREMTRQGFNSWADVIRDALKYYRWSKEQRRSVEAELEAILSDPEKAGKFANLVAQSVFKMMREQTLK